MKNIIFLHHSTGYNIWLGNTNKYISKLTGKGDVIKCFDKYNRKNNTDYHITEQFFPKSSPYGWNNYPYDYYNIWVKNAGEKPYMDEPTLEILTKKSDVIIFKHCFPVSNIMADDDSTDIDSDYKSISNYKSQYLALRDKLHAFPETKFIAFTGAALVKSAVTEEEALRSKEFFSWVVNEWDIPDDNIHIWDFYSLETEDGIYLKDEYAVSHSDSHPNSTFARKMARLLFNRIIDVIETNGNNTSLTGEKL